MRRFIGTALALGLVAAVTWQVSSAQTNESAPVALCIKAGTDVRAPATNGTCPSGYSKRTIEDGFERLTGQTITVSYALLAIQQQGDELDVQLTAATPDGEVRSQIVQNVSAFGDMGSFTFTNPVIGGYDFGIRVLGPLERAGDTVPFRISVQRPGEGFVTLLDDLEIGLATTGGDIVETVPYVLTPSPIVRPPA